MTDNDQGDSAGKYTFGGGGGSGGKRLWPTIIKGVELLLCIVCIGLFDDPANNSRVRIFVSPRTIDLGYATFATFLIICATYLLGKVIRDAWPWRTLAVLSFIGTILFLACGVCILKDWSDTKERSFWPPNTTRLDLLCATGFIALLTAITFLVDLVLTVREGIRGGFDEE